MAFATIDQIKERVAEAITGAGIGFVESAEPMGQWRRDGALKGGKVFVIHLPVTRVTEPRAARRGAEGVAAITQVDVMWTMRLKKPDMKGSRIEALQAELTLLQAVQAMTTADKGFVHNAPRLKRIRRADGRGEEVADLIFTAATWDIPHRLLLRP